ncbi:hypothetical protein BCR33DRAFT_195017 [Rhizoclosmatium globosum]|uniref:Cyclin N-terminal domain-containing protein n=1 Tax=Rhizoclosmatium globosum TaxID=329046 RepID=A0A1Y2CDU2_9FUNG|nr:hypothetical protein BCR33DRAFT_195017 [Rhizoclosmatium globosum]|eukprot:ORY45192.1 hypothetical protein BCR33DRAFT_195017 [Rhizoclosmatium globosum]
MSWSTLLSTRFMFIASTIHTFCTLSCQDNTPIIRRVARRKNISSSLLCLTNTIFDTDPLIHYRLLFLSLLTAYKYINELSVANLAWQRESQDKFSLEEVNAMERMFLSMLKFDLRVEDSGTQAEWVHLLEKVSKRRLDSPDTLFALTPTTSLQESLGEAKSLTGSNGERRSSKSIESALNKWKNIWKFIRGKNESV